MSRLQGMRPGFAGGRRGSSSVRKRLAAWSCAGLVALLGSAAGVDCGFGPAPAFAADEEDDLDALQEKAFREAVAKVAPSVVRVETIGGLEQIGQGQAKVLVGTGPTTGLVVGAEGWILSSAFNFAQKPTSILIGLPDGSRAPAKLVATDFNRMLTLLKIDAPGLGLQLAVPTVAPIDEVKVGQWAITVGRTFDGGPNLSVGIVSATNRIWGKAVQVDAKASPSNYGGPLVDIHGRVIGVLVPASPQGGGELAGVEWYDSGIAFASPLEHVLKVLPALKEGKNLKGGIMGVVFKNQDDMGSEPVINSVRGGSPASEANLKPGDRIVEMDGKPIKRLHGVRHTLGPRYAGDEVKVVVLRDGQRIEKSLKLVAELQAYQFPFLGIVPGRVEAAAGPIPVRYVVPDSPAAAAKILPGDVLVKIGEQDVPNQEKLAEALSQVKIDQPLPLQVRRGSESLTMTLKPAADRAWQPKELPPAVAADKLGPKPADAPKTGALEEQKIAEFKNIYFAYVPSTYHPAAPASVLVWLHEPGGFDSKKLLEQWKPYCEKHQCILVAPKSAEAEKWLPTEAEFIQKAVEEIAQEYRVDRRRIVVGGRQAGAGMALIAAARNRAFFRGVALIEPIPSAPIGDNDPAQRLRVWLATADGSNGAKAFEKYLAQLKSQKFPVVESNLGKESRPLKPDETESLLRWIDALDVF